MKNAPPPLQVVFVVPARLPDPWLNLSDLRNARELQAVGLVLIVDEDELAPAHAEHLGAPAIVASLVGRMAMRIELQHRHHFWLLSRDLTRVRCLVPPHSRGALLRVCVLHDADALFVLELPQDMVARPRHAAQCERWQVSEESRTTLRTRRR